MIIVVVFNTYCFTKKKKVMEQERQEEGLKEKVEKKVEKALGANMSLKTRQKFREGVIEIEKATGDSCTEDVLDNCLIELSRLENDQSKGMVIAALMSELPLILQKVICDKMRETITLEIVAQTFGGLK
jgi:hypothetical protein